MSYRVKVGLLALSLLVLGACRPTPFQAEFAQYGLVGAAAPPPSVPDPSQVLVFYGNSPPGFTLRDNELAVEPGYGHRILGRVSVVKGTASGNRDDSGRCKSPDSKRDTAELIREKAQEGAHRAGANAIVYYTADVPANRPPKDFQDICVNKARDDRYYASGWAVLLAPGGQPVGYSPEPAPLPPGAPQPSAPIAPLPAAPPADAP